MAADRTPRRPRLRAGDRRGTAALPRDGQRRRRPADRADLRRRAAEVLRRHARSRSSSSAPRTAGSTRCSSCPPSTWRCGRKWTAKGIGAHASSPGTDPVPVLLRRAQRHAEDARRRARLTRPTTPTSSDPDPEDLRLMCGLLAYFSTDADRVDDATVDARAATPSTACATAVPTRPESWSDSRAVFGFNRLSIIDVEHSHQPMPYADGRYRIVFNGEIYNYLELREELAAAGARPSPPRATPRRSSPATTSGARTSSPAARHVRLRHLGQPDRHGVRRPRPVRHQAAVHRAAGRRRPGLRSEKKALLELLGGSKARRRRRPGVPAALPDAAVRARAGHHAPRHPPDRERHAASRWRTASCTRRATSTRPSPSEPVAKDERAGALRPDRRRPRRLGARCTCAPTSRSARSCPAASTRPRSPRWPSATTRSC